MPFGERTMAEQRKSLVEEIRLGERSISAICRDWGISRPTAYKWLRRSEAGEPMNDMSRAPQRSPSRTSPAVEEAVVSARREHPCWGGRKLKRFLERKSGRIFPSASTVTAILHRNKLVSPEASRAATPCQRFEKPHPNDMWQADFKGHFEMLDGNRCHPLTVTDDHSRYNLCISAKENERLLGVMESFIILLREYGLPLAVLCDNGSPWGASSSTGGHTKFEVFLMDYGIIPVHGRPLHPQTQGKEERFHRTLKRELLAREPIKDLPNAQAKFDAFRWEYNEERPHCALGYAVPADRYRVSERVMPERISGWEYPQGVHVRNVHGGCITFKYQHIFLSKGLEGRQVAIVQSGEDGIVDIIYRNFIIAKVSLKENYTISRKITILGER